MDQNHNLQLLGIAKKAGLIAVGGEAVSYAARVRKAKLIICAADASERSVRRAKISAKNENIFFISVPYTKFELGSITGRGSPGTVAILDVGLAAGFVKGLAVTDGSYQELADTLAAKAEAITKRKRETRKQKTSHPTQRRTKQ